MVRLAVTGLVLGGIAVGLLAMAASRPAEKESPKVSLRPMLLHEADPSTPIKHGVEWKNALDPIRHESLLSGPQLYSTESNLNAEATEAIVFSWYQLSDSDKTRQPKNVRVLTDQGKQHEFKVGAATFFLSKTQRLQDGAPPEPPENLSHFVAYPVLDASEEDGDFELSTADGPKSVTLKQAMYVCLPTQEWHHDEYFPVTDASSAWIVYEIEPMPTSDAVSTLDQFGFNKLSLSPARWVCLPSSISKIE